MRALFGGTGINIFLGLKDKEEGNKTGKLECRINGYNNPLLLLNIVGEVTRHSILEEPGFHIQGTPKKSAIDKRSKYTIYLSKKRFDELTNPKEDPIIHGGFFESRCLYDRLSINYYAV